MLQFNHRDREGNLDHGSAAGTKNRERLMDDETRISRAANRGSAMVEDQAEDLTVRPYFRSLVAHEPSQVVKNTQLVNASTDGDIDSVRELLENGADARTAEDEPLLDAAANGHTAIVELLMAHDANVHARFDEALVLAAQAGHIDTVRFLQNQGPSIEAQTRALHAAQDADHGDVVKLFETGIPALRRSSIVHHRL